MIDLWKLFTANSQEAFARNSNLFDNTNLPESLELKDLTDEEKKVVDIIPLEGIAAIRKAEVQSKVASKTTVTYNELEVSVPMWKDVDDNLLSALNEGTAYTINNGKVYIWYNPLKGIYGAGYYRMKRYEIIRMGHTIAKYILDKNDMLSNDL